MKRHGNLFEKIISIENILLAHKNARKGKRHYASVKRFDAHPYHNARKIRAMLKTKEWRPSAYRQMDVVERGKKRGILKVDYMPDRVIHHALMQVIEPILVNTLIKDTYQSIKGRGIHKGVTRIRQWMSDEWATRYALKIDIKKFYPSVDNEILKKMLRKKIKCADTLWLLDSLIDSAKGLPIGNYTSQLLGNFYLSFFDHWVKEEKKIKKYIRYADDMVFFAEDKESLHTLKKEIVSYLDAELNLKLKENHQIFMVRERGLDYLGYRFFCNYILMRKNIAKKFRQVLTAQISSVKEVSSITSYYGWAMWADSYNFLKKHLYPILPQIRRACAIAKVKNPFRDFYFVTKERKMITPTLF